MDLHSPDARLTELRERLAELPAPLAFLESFFALGPIPLIVFRADGHPLLTNQAFRDMFQSEPPPEYNVLEDELVARAGLADLIRRAGVVTHARRPAARRVRVCPVDRHTAEACLVVDDGVRVRAVALRLEAHRGAWRVTTLEIG